MSQLDQNTTNLQNILETVNSLPSGGGVQPDWNQNDSTAADFIKNKPFGDVESVIIPEQTTPVDTNGSNQVTALFVPNIGDTVTVEWNGVAYTCQAVSGAGAIAVGNTGAFGGEDTGEPFAFLFVSTAMVFVACTDEEVTSATIKVVGFATNKIPEKYYSVTKTFYVSDNPATDAYIYTDAGRTNKVTAQEVWGALQNSAVVFTNGSLHIYGFAGAVNESGAFVKVSLTRVAEESFVPEYYYSAEYTPS